MGAPVDGQKNGKERKPKSRTLGNAYFQGEMKEGQERWTYQTWSKGISVLSGVSQFVQGGTNSIMAYSSV